jgi:ribosome-associated protein
MQARRVTVTMVFTELEFSSSRSGGPGGQNVNKVESKILLKWDIAHSGILNPEEKELLQKKLSPHLTKDGVLQLTSQESRSQLENKDRVVQKLELLLAQAQTKRKKRKATKPSKTSVQKRITGKKIRSEKKKWRQRPD